MSSTNSQFVQNPNVYGTGYYEKIKSMDYEQHHRDSVQIRKGLSSNFEYFPTFDSSATFNQREVVQSFSFTTTPTTKGVQALGANIKSGQIKEEHIIKPKSAGGLNEVIGVALDCSELQVVEIYLKGTDELMAQCKSRQEEGVVAGNYLKAAKLRGYALRYAAIKGDNDRAAAVLAMGGIEVRDVGAALLEAVKQNNTIMIDTLIEKLKTQGADDLEKQTRAEVIASAINQATLKGNALLANSIIEKVKAFSPQELKAVDPALEKVAEISPQQIFIVAFICSLLIAAYQAILSLGKYLNSEST